MIYPWQQDAWETVQNARQRDRLPHALLFTGEDGCGNEGFVRVLAQSLLCLEPIATGAACGQCRSCQVFAGQAHPDYMAVGLQEDRQAIVIEQIRELNHFLGLSRSYSPRRVVVIYPAERMNVNAANSLLKSLEEPANNTHILLLSSHPALLLSTIRSRCQMMRLPVPSTESALLWLKQQTLQHDAQLLLTAARGRPMAALQLDSTDMLIQRQQWLAHIAQMISGRGNIVEISAQWEKYDKTVLLDWQLDCVHGLIKQLSVNQNYTSYLPDLNDFLTLTRPTIWEIHAGLLELKKIAIHPINPRLFVESMLMLWQVKLSHNYHL